MSWCHLLWLGYRSCFGGNLTALIWETKEIVQVKAKKVYYKSDFDIQGIRSDQYEGTKSRLV